MGTEHTLLTVDRWRSNSRTCGENVGKTERRQSTNGFGFKIIKMQQK